MLTPADDQLVKITAIQTRRHIRPIHGEFFIHPVRRLVLRVSAVECFAMTKLFILGRLVQCAVGAVGAVGAVVQGVQAGGTASYLFGPRVSCTRPEKPVDAELFGRMGICKHAWPKRNPILQSSPTDFCMCEMIMPVRRRPESPSTQRCGKEAAKNTGGREAEAEAEAEALRSVWERELRKRRTRRRRRRMRKENGGCHRSPVTSHESRVMSHEQRGRETRRRRR